MTSKPTVEIVEGHCMISSSVAVVTICVGQVVFEIFTILRYRLRQMHWSQTHTVSENIVAHGV